MTTRTETSWIVRYGAESMKGRKESIHATEDAAQKFFELQVAAGRHVDVFIRVKTITEKKLT